MEDFPFPCLQLEQCNNARTLPFPHFASPSPWRVAGSSVGTAGQEHEHEHHRRSCSAVEPHQAAAACSDRHTMAVAAGHYQHHHGSARYAAEEDRMDMLWEDFNEELARAAPPCPLTKGSPWATAAREVAGDDDDCVTRKHAVVRRKRMGLLAMLRLLKKLFLAHKSGATAARKAPPI